MTFKRRIIDELETVGGRHDEPEIYSGAPGDPGLAGGPASMSWEINGDMASLAVGGSAAIIMEVLHPSVMAGVFEQSSYRTEPIQRAQNTLGYVLRTTFGTTAAATRVIERVKKVHSHINGTRPDGVPYRALDPELIAWVHTCIPWAVMNAFDRYCRPLTTDEKDRYLAEQAVIGRMGGAEWVPETTAELDDYVGRMKPKMSMNEQTRSFIAFLAGDTGDADAASTRKQIEGRLGLRGSMSLMPDWARHLTGTYHPWLAQQVYFDHANRLQARVVRWAYPELPCKRLALDRCAAGPASTGEASRSLDVAS